MEEHVQDSLERIKDQTHRLEELRATEAEISDARTTEMVYLRHSGVSREVIADAAGLTPARVTQILGKVGEARVQRGPVVRSSVPTVARSAPKVVEPAIRVLAADPHRHHYVSTAWNHRRGGFLVRQRCDCGLTRVIPATSVPKELSRAYPDTSVVA